MLTTIFPFERLGDNCPFRIVSMGSDASPGSDGKRSLLRRGISHVDKLLRLQRMIIQYRPTIVHLHNPLGRLDFGYLRMLKSLGARVVYTAHDARPLDGNTSWFDRSRYSAADAIFVHSSNSVQELAAEGIDPSKIVLVPHGNYLHFCEDTTYSAVEAKRLLGIPVDAHAILFFGSIAPYKGLDTLIDAFSLIVREIPSAYLIIAGQPLQDFTPYLQRINRAAISERVLLDLRYVPFSDFPKYFRGADFAVFPHRRIYQSGVLQLAYAYRRAVVVTAVGGLAEAVLADHTGVISRTNDAQGLAEAMCRLLLNPAEAAVMGNRGRHLAETKYSWDSVARRVIDTYLRVTER